MSIATDEDRRRRREKIKLNIVLYLRAILLSNYHKGDDDNDDDVELRGISPLNQEKSESLLSQYKVDPHILFQGMFMKKRRSGGANTRFICCTRTHIFWSKSASELYRTRQKKGNESKSGCAIAFKDVQRVEAGKTTAAFRRRTTKKAEANICFSLITTDRTLDLQAPTPVDAAHWVAAIQRWIGGPLYLGRGQ